MLKRQFILPYSIFFVSEKIGLQVLMKSVCQKIIFSGMVLLLFAQSLKAQLPTNVLVGYHENWRSLTILDAHANYNVINLAFALPRTTGPNATCRCDIMYTRPPAYATNAAFMADIDALHAAGKKVLLSLGGATGPIYLPTAAERTIFVNSINAIFTTYSNKIDGIDLDLETTSMSDIPATWTMSAPAPAQTNMVLAVKSIMATYLANTGKKMLLTAAPEVYYLNGALSPWQVLNHGGVFLPILEGLRNEMDCLFMQLYNAPGGMYAGDGIIYYEGTPEFTLAMNETVIMGFTLLDSKGTFSGWPASKMAFGLPATPAGSTATSGFLSYANICNAVKYFRGTIPKPGGWGYTLSASYPSLKGLMTWDIYEDKMVSSPAWSFATSYGCAFPVVAPVELLNFTAQRSNDKVSLNWATASETNNDYFSVERSADGISFSEITKIKGAGNSVAEISYYHADQNTSPENSYYRLAQYDFDGAVHYSAVVTVESSLGNSGLLFSSNPFDDVLIVSSYGQESNGEAFVSVLDCSGKTVTSKTVHNREEFRIGEEYTTGFYILQYEYQGEIKRYKIVKR